MARGIFRMLREPALVDDDVLPAKALQVVVKPGDGIAELRFIDGVAPGVPAVPAHGRGLDDDAHILTSGRAGDGNCEKSQNHRQ